MSSSSSQETYRKGCVHASYPGVSKVPLLTFMSIKPFYFQTTLMRILLIDLVTYLSYGLLTAHREVKDVLKALSNSLQETLLCEQHVWSFLYVCRY